MVQFIFQSSVVLLVSDFITGIIHWWEDAYGNPKWKILGKHIVEPNLLHHNEPRAFLKGNYWQRNNTALIAALVLIGIPFVCGWFSRMYAAIIVLASQGNEIHRKAHQTDKENGHLIVWLQKLGIFQSRKHHGWHHKAPYNCNYCILTNYLNPILQKLKLWEGLEWFILKVFSIAPLRGSSLRGGK